MQARHDTIQDVKPDKTSTFASIRLSVILLVSALICETFAQTPLTASQPGFPYKAEVTGSSVNVRAGKSTTTYECGKLNEGDVVEVYGEEDGWAKIAPPTGSFSWIAMQYITINVEAPTTGIVTGRNIKVYAGSDYREPMNSNVVQAVVTRGDTVQITGEMKDNYLKIFPPKGSYLWVSTRYLKQIEEPVISSPLVVLPNPAELPPDINDSIQPEMLEIDPNLPENVLSEAALLKRYYEIQEMIKAEQAKPIAQQDYSKIKKALTEIASRKDTTRAARYADFTLKRVNGYELAISVSKQLTEQDEQLAQIRANIEKARTAAIAQVQDMGKYAVIGTLKPSNVYDGAASVQRFRIQDETGKTICYVKPVGEAINKDLKVFYEKKVGLVGSIKANPESGGVIVEFTGIELIQ